jgi:hypothetical protein
MTSAWKPIPRPRGPVSSSDPVRLTIEARWSGPSRSVFRLPEADHVPAKARDSPGASAPSGPLGGPEHALQRTRAAGTSHHGAPLASLERHRSIPWSDPPATMLNAPLISRRCCQSPLGRSTRSIDSRLTSFAFGSGQIMCSLHRSTCRLTAAMYRPRMPLSHAVARRLLMWLWYRVPGVYFFWRASDRAPGSALATEGR